MAASICVNADNECGETMCRWEPVMHLLANTFVLLVAALHTLIGLAEMLLFTRPRVYGRLERFAFTHAEAQKVAPIVANAGLYNLFVAAGLVASFVTGDGRAALFVLSFVFIAGLYGAVTLKPTTLFLQSAPAAAAALAIWNA